MTMLTRTKVDNPQLVALASGERQLEGEARRTKRCDRKQRRQALLGLGLLGGVLGGDFSVSAVAEQVEGESGPRRGITACSCPTTSPCPTTSNGLVEIVPAPLVAWSSVTGRCLPWGPLGPLGVIGGSLLFRRAVLSLRNPRNIKDAKDVKSRRSLKRERQLRSLDALAKQNTPFVGAIFVLLLSIPRTQEGLVLSGASALLGIAAATLSNKEDKVEG